MITNWSFMAGRDRGSARAVPERRAGEIAAGGLVLDLKNGRYRVESQSEPGKYYDVNLLDDWTCTCPYHVKRRTDCKHIIAVQMMVMGVEPLAPADFVMKKPGIRCTNKECGSTGCEFYQERERKMGGASVRYRCTACRNRFTHRPGFLGRHYPDGAVSRAPGDVGEGRSLAGAARAVPKNSHTGVKTREPERSTVLRRVRDAGRAAAGVTGSIPVRTCGRWDADEIYCPTGRGGGRYMSEVMDSESRFILAGETYPAGDKLQSWDATRLLKRAMRVAGTAPQVLVSDRPEGFARGFKKAVLGGRRRGGGRRPVHIRSASVRKRHVNNSRMERKNGTTRDRIRAVRGFGSDNPALLLLFNAYYNFIRPHTGIKGRTPAEYMGIRIDGTDKWETLLAFASAC